LRGNANIAASADHREQMEAVIFVHSEVMRLLVKSPRRAARHL
jgi:hypothetical protein